jgi:alkaline phosphatase D
MTLSRRDLLAATAAAGVAAALPTLPAAAAPGPSGAAAPSIPPGVVRRGRPSLPSGVATGDVTSRSAVLWSRTDRRARLVVDLTSRGRFDRAVRLRGPITGPNADFTAQLPLRGLRPGQRYDYRIGFEDSYGRLGETAVGSFRTPGRNRPVSFVWTGDTAGQGYGINPDLGGMAAYRTMHETRPDFFLHSGDNIYADGPIQAELTAPDGTVWRNVVTEEVAKVAETLAEFRGRYKYNLLDHNVRDLYADVPIVSQWDDHETVNNWYPGEILTDDRYTEKRVDVLAARARKAFAEYLPIAYTEGRGRLYRKVSHGPLLDVFCLDMRTYRGPNPAPGAAGPLPILGAEQAAWLVREVARSRATWKVIASDMPLGLLVPGRAGYRSGRERPARGTRGSRAGDRVGAEPVQAPAGAQHGLADGRRALLRRPPLRPGPRRLHRLRPVLGTGRGPDQRGHLRTEPARPDVRAAGRFRQGGRLPEPAADRRKPVLRSRRHRPRLGGLHRLPARPQRHRAVAQGPGPRLSRPRRGPAAPVRRGP